MEVSREKYEKAKYAFKLWHDKAKEQESDIDNLKILLKTNEEKNRLLNEEIIELKNKLADLLKEKIIYEGRIQQQQEFCNDLRERYNELKQDFREYQKWRKDG